MARQMGLAEIAAETRSPAAIAPALVVTALGLFVLFMVGFSPIDAVHNAAHDVRHSSAFPCH